VKIEFDPAKSLKNISSRNLPFDLAHEFDWRGAVYFEDDRKSYPERRFGALGFMEDRLYFICFTPIEGGARVISFRKANKREVRHYEKEKAIN